MRNYQSFKSSRSPKSAIDGLSQKAKMLCAFSASKGQRSSLEKLGSIAAEMRRRLERKDFAKELLGDEIYAILPSDASPGVEDALSQYTVHLSDSLRKLVELKEIVETSTSHQSTDFSRTLKLSRLKKIFLAIEGSLLPSQAERAKFSENLEAFMEASKKSASNDTNLIMPPVNSNAQKTENISELLLKITYRKRELEKLLAEASKLKAEISNIRKSRQKLVGLSDFVTKNGSAPLDEHAQTPAKFQKFCKEASQLAVESHFSNTVKIQKQQRF